MDKYSIESHKLIYHPGRVYDWLTGKNIYPIYVEISPVSGCNHRCNFCALDYLRDNYNVLDKEILKSNLSQMAEVGVKSIMYAGEGEPLLHKDIVDIVKFTKSLGMDVAITTNGVFLDKILSEKLLPRLSWIRISINAGNRVTYANIHRTKSQDFDTVLSNLYSAVKVKKKYNLNSTIGVQTLLLPENYKEIIFLSKILKKIEIDYLIIKPYSQHPMSKSTIYKNLDYTKYLKLTEEIENISDKRFKIIFRKNTIEKLKQEKKYLKCLGTNFWSYIKSDGDVYACSSFLGNKKFCYGNIYKDTFKNIWNSLKKEKILKYINNKLDVSKCRKVCRLDEINKYLWELKNPVEHVNFI